LTCEKLVIAEGASELTNERADLGYMIYILWVGSIE